MLNILVIHGYVQTAETVRANSRRLANELSGIATLDYVDGPPPPDRSWAPSRPWWFLKTGAQWLDHDIQRENGRWEQVVKWWSKLLSEKQYDGIIGLSQGAAMTALLLSMLNDPSRVPGFGPVKPQPLKFAILCSGFVSRTAPHKNIYNIPMDLPTVHTVDDYDPVVAASRTVELKNMFGEKAMLMKHTEGHSIPTGGDLPNVFKEYILNAVHVYNNRSGGAHHHGQLADAHGNGHAHAEHAHAHDPHAHDGHAHAHDAHAHDAHAHAHDAHAHDAHAHDAHAHDAHAHDAHVHDPHLHAHDPHAHDPHAHDLKAQDVHAQSSMQDPHHGHGKENAPVDHHAHAQDPFASPQHSPVPHRQDTTSSVWSQPPVYEAVSTEASGSGAARTPQSPLTFDSAYAVGQAHTHN